MSQPFRPDSSEKWWYNNKNTVFNIYCVASCHPIFSFLFFPGLDHKRSRDTKYLIYYVTGKLRFSDVAKFWKVLIFTKLWPLYDYKQISLRPCVNMLESACRSFLTRFCFCLLLCLWRNHYSLSVIEEEQTLTFTLWFRRIPCSANTTQFGFPK